MVILSDDEHFVKSEFSLRHLNWDDGMRLMLGEKFPILAIIDYKNSSYVALPSPDGSQDGKWYFPKSLVTSGMKFYFNSESDSES